MKEKSFLLYYEFAMLIHVNVFTRRQRTEILRFCIFTHDNTTQIPGKNRQIIVQKTF